MNLKMENVEKRSRGSMTVSCGFRIFIALSPFIFFHSAQLSFSAIKKGFIGHVTAVFKGVRV